MSLLRRIITVGSGTALAQIITAASTPLLTRLFAPEAHAAWAIFLSTSVIFSGVATFRYDLAIVLPKDRRQSANLMLAGCASAAAFSLLAGTVLGLVGPHYLPPELHQSLRLWCWLVPVSVLSTAVYQLAAAWCVREAAFSLYSASQFSLPMGILAGQLLFAAGGHRDAWGLIGGTVCGQFGVATTLGGLLWRRDRIILRSASWRSIVEIAKTYRNYPLYMTPYTLVGLSRERLAYFLLGRLGTAAAAGHYNLVARLINLPNSFVASTLRPVFFQHAASQNPRALEQPVLEIVRTLGLISVLLYAPCIVQAPWLFGVVFGPAWIPAAPYAIALSLPAIPLLMGNWADRKFDVLGRQRTALTMEVVFSLIAMAGLVGGYWVFRDLLSAVVIQSLLLTVYYCFWLGALFKAAGYDLTRLARSLLEVACIGGAVWGWCFLGGRVLEPPVAFGATFLLSVGLSGLIGWRSWRSLGNFLGR